MGGIWNLVVHVLSVGSMGDKHFVILGAGAVGLTLAAFLRTQNHRITLLTRSGTAALPVHFHDEINDRALVLTARDVEVRRASDAPRSADHLIVCTRGEQLDAALAQLRDLDPSVPITNAAATLADVPALAREHGLPHPLLVMGVGFAAWPVGEQRYRVFALQPPGPVIAPLPSGGTNSTAARRAAKELAHILAAAGFPAQAPPPVLFRWVFQTMLTLEVAFMHGYRRAGWELDALCAHPELLRLCGAAMRESAGAIVHGGPIALVARMIPAPLFARFTAYRARTANEGFRAVWRHHGPKVTEQLDLLTEQVLSGARGKSMGALRELARH